MTIRYRVLCGLAVLGFAGLGQPVLGQDVSQTLKHQESLKGKIWSATARRIWTDIRPKQPPQPKPWATGTEFTQWALAQKDDKSELGLLRGAVIDRIGKGHTGTPDQVAQAILAEIAQRRSNKTGALARLNADALRVDLNKFRESTPAKPVETSTEPLPTSAAPKVETPSARFPKDTAQVPDMASDSESVANYSAAVLEHTHFGLPFWAAALALTLLGGVAGAMLYALLKPARRSSRRHQQVQDPSEPNTGTDMFKQDRKQKGDIQRLEGEVRLLKRENEALKAQIAGQSAPTPNPAPQPAPEPVAELADHDLLTPTPLAEMPVERPSQPQAVTRYGPVQETPFLEERKVSDAPLPQLALMLTLHPGTPDQASFTLNPQVNQSMLIGDGLDRLKRFFDYDLPMGRISSVTAAAPGRLQHHADGWQVVERARLTVR